MNYADELKQKITLWESQIKEGTYIPPEAITEQYDGKIKLHKLHYDGSDLWINRQRKEAGKPYLKVVEPKCLGYSRKDSLVRAIRELTLIEIEKAGCCPRLGMYIPTEGKDFELVQKFDSKVKNATDLYITSSLVMLLALKESKGNDAFRVPVDNSFEIQIQKFGESVELICQQTRLENVSPYFEKLKRDVEFHRRWMAERKSE